VEAEGAEVFGERACAGMGHVEAGEIVTEFSGEDWAKTSAEQIHGVEIQGHGGAAENGRNNVLKGGIDTGVIEICEETA